jgi:orotate phosphoribosyltransferase
VRAEEIPVSFIAGTSTSGIPHATTLADKLGLPMVYIRDKPKDHGMKNRIEGIDAEKDLEGRKGVVIEDLISTGGSSARAVQGVREANGSVDYCLAIFNYGFEKAAKLFTAEGDSPLTEPCEVRSILTYDILMEVARASDKFTKEQLEMLEEWGKDAFGWGAKFGFPKIER